MDLVERVRAAHFTDAVGLHVLPSVATAGGFAAVHGRGGTDRGHTHGLSGFAAGRTALGTTTCQRPNVLSHWRRPPDSSSLPGTKAGWRSGTRSRQYGTWPATGRMSSSIPAPQFRLAAGPWNCAHRRSTNSRSAGCARSLPADQTSGRSPPCWHCAEAATSAPTCCPSSARWYRSTSSAWASPTCRAGWASRPPAPLRTCHSSGCTRNSRAAAFTSIRCGGPHSRCRCWRPCTWECRPPGDL